MRAPAVPYLYLLSAGVLYFYSNEIFTCWNGMTALPSLTWIWLTRCNKMMQCNSLCVFIINGTKHSHPLFMCLWFNYRSHYVLKPCELLWQQHWTTRLDHSNLWAQSTSTVHLFWGMKNLFSSLKYRSYACVTICGRIAIAEKYYSKKMSCKSRGRSATFDYKVKVACSAKIRSDMRCSS